MLRKGSSDYRTSKIRTIDTNVATGFADMNSIMDVTTISGASAFQQQKVQNSVQSSVDAKVLNIAKTEGTGALQLLQGASLQTGAQAGQQGSPITASGGVDTFA